jgi:hypothetical protein
MIDIDELLQENDLKHFQYFQEEGKILYTHENGTSQHTYDFNRLLKLLRVNKIDFMYIGLDVIMLEN